MFCNEILSHSNHNTVDWEIFIVVCGCFITTNILFHEPQIAHVNFIWNPQKHQKMTKLLNVLKSMHAKQSKFTV